MKLVPHLIACLVAVPPLAAQSTPVGGSASDASSIDLGGGTQGFFGEPRIGLIGSPVIGRPLSLVVRNGRPGALFAIGVSAPTTPIPLPQFGAVVHASGPFAALALSQLDARGESAPLFTLTAVDAALTGVPFTTQAFVADAAALGGAAFSDALAMRFGIDDGRHWFHAPSVPVPGGPVAVTTGDFDSDGILDCATVNVSQGTVSVVLGRGNGLLGEPATYSTSLGILFALAGQIDSGDVDGDGALDVVASLSVPASQYLFRGNGDGTLQPSILLSNVIGGTDLELVDVNADGNSDLILANATQVLLRLANGLGGFGPASVLLDVPANVDALECELVDVDNDTDLDLLVATSNGLRIAVGDGAGNFGAAQSSGSTERLYDVVTGFVDGDAEVDLAVLVGTPIRLETRLGNGAGAFTAAPGSTVVDAEGSCALADVDGDGLTDAVVSRLDWASPNVRVHLGDGSGAFDANGSELSLTNSYRTVVDDLDGDGDDDLVGADATALAALLTEGRGAVQSGVRSDLGTWVSGIELADLDADGELDLVTLSPETLALVSARNIGGGRFGAPSSVSSPMAEDLLAIGDQNGDGHVDAFLARFLGSGIVMHRGLPGGNFAAGVLLNTGRPTSAATLADIDNDGIVDLVTHVRGLAEVTILLGNANGTFQAPQTIPVGAPVGRVVTGDIDADGDVDLVVAPDMQFVVSVLLNNGSGVFNQASTVVLPLRMNFAELGDFDGDGHVDLLVATALAEESFRLYSGDGTGSFNAGVPLSIPSTNRFWTTDVDGDGLEDIVANRGGSAGGVSIEIWKGDGSGGFVRAQTFASNPAMNVADVDGDGFDDIVLLHPDNRPEAVDVRPNQFVE
jgi:hypothetical protein